MDGFYQVYCIDTRSWHTMQGKNAQDALNRMKYYLDLSHKDVDATVVELKHSFSLSHSGLTYGVLKERKQTN